LLSLISCNNTEVNTQKMLESYLKEHYPISENPSAQFYYNENQPPKEFSSEVIRQYLPSIHFYYVRLGTHWLEAPSVDAILSVDSITSTFRTLWSPAVTSESQQDFFNLFKGLKFSSDSEAEKFKYEIQNMYLKFNYNPKIEITGSNEGDIKINMLDTIPYAIINYHFENNKLIELRYIPAGSPGFVNTESILVQYLKTNYPYQSTNSRGYYYGEKSTVVKIPFPSIEKSGLKDYTFWKVEFYTGIPHFLFANAVIAMKGKDTGSLKFFWTPNFNNGQEEFLQIFSKMSFSSEREKAVFMDEFSKMISSILIQPEIIPPVNKKSDTIIYTLNQDGSYLRKLEFHFREKQLLSIAMVK
jgi:hypothetical protein